MLEAALDEALPAGVFLAKYAQPAAAAKAAALAAFNASDSVQRATSPGRVSLLRKSSDQRSMQVGTGRSTVKQGGIANSIQVVLFIMLHFSCDVAAEQNNFCLPFCCATHSLIVYICISRTRHSHLRSSSSKLHHNFVFRCCCPRKTCVKTSTCCP